jgi:hypothetical protein
LALVLRDRGDPDLAGAEQQVAVVGEVLAAGGDHLDREVDTQRSQVDGQVER